MHTLENLYESIKNEELKNFLKFLSFESVSSEGDKRQGCENCVQWLKAYVEDLGFETELWKTLGHPILYAKDLSHGEDKPTLLIYNHYDVQPVDPIDAWDSPPFEPSIRDGQVYARGAQDNKGQCFTVLQALKLLHKRDQKFPLNIKLIIEGEEETGSMGLSSLLKTKEKELKADYAAIVDLGMRKKDKPAITLGIRGIVAVNLEVVGSKMDLHSGSHGGIAYNPIHALVSILSALRDKKGRITVPGFYDTVQNLTPKEREKIDCAFDAANYKEMFQAAPEGGETDYSPLERAWLRPTLEINGINGGYTGFGLKTVIPARAEAKISCRLVPDQDPVSIGRAVAEYLKSLEPKGVTVNAYPLPGVGKAYRSKIHSKSVSSFAKAYEEVFQTPVEYIFEGASIPIAHQLSHYSGSSLVLLGLGLPDDAIHAPNEHFGLDRLKKGSLSIARAIELLAVS